MTKFLWAVAGLVIAALAEGFALKTLWAWFVVPTFPVPILLWAQAIGISLTLKVFTGTVSIGAEQAALLEEAGVKRNQGEAILRSVLLPFIMLGIGWVYRLFL